MSCVYTLYVLCVSTIFVLDLWFNKLKNKEQKMHQKRKKAQQPSQHKSQDSVEICKHVMEKDLKKNNHIFNMGCVTPCSSKVRKMVLTDKK